MQCSAVLAARWEALCWSWKPCVVHLLPVSVQRSPHLQGEVQELPLLASKPRLLIFGCCLSGRS